MRVKMLLVMEVKIPGGKGDPDDEAQRVLDHFREGCSPFLEYGIFLRRATVSDWDEFKNIVHGPFVGCVIEKG